MKTAITIALLAALTGCAAHIVSSSERTVVVRGMTNDDYADSQVLANAECKKYGRVARLSGRPVGYSSDFVYDCVL